MRLKLLSASNPHPTFFLAAMMKGNISCYMLQKTGRGKSQCLAESIKICCNTMYVENLKPDVNNNESIDDSEITTAPPLIYQSKLIAPGANSPHIPEVSVKFLVQKWFEFLWI
jgi:hypothetical protein